MLVVPWWWATGIVGRSVGRTTADLRWGGWEFLDAGCVGAVEPRLGIGLRGIAFEIS